MERRIQQSRYRIAKLCARQRYAVWIRCTHAQKHPSELHSSLAHRMHAENTRAEKSTFDLPSAILKLIRAMALAAHEVNVAAGDNHVVGHERAVVVDPELGIGGRVEKGIVVDKERGVAAHVEKATVAVDLGGGQVGVLHQQRVLEVQAAPDVCYYKMRARLHYSLDPIII